MGNITNALQTTYYIFHNGNDVFHHGIVPIGGYAAESGLPYTETFDDEESWLNRLTALGVTGIQLSAWDQLEYRPYPHVSVPAQYWNVNVEDLVDGMGFSTENKQLIAPNFSWWYDEDGTTLIVKPDNPTVNQTEVTPTVEQFNNFKGLLASGRRKERGIQTLFEDKNNPSDKYYLVGLPFLKFKNGEMEALWQVAANLAVPNFTVYEKGVSALEDLEVSA